MDIQNRYDNLISYRDSLTAQIECLARKPNVCIHRVVEDMEVYDNIANANTIIKVCQNPKCKKVVDKGSFGQCKYNNM